MLRQFSRYFLDVSGDGGGGEVKATPPQDVKEDGADGNKLEDIWKQHFDEFKKTFEPKLASKEKEIAELKAKIDALSKKAPAEKEKNNDDQKKPNENAAAEAYEKEIAELKKSLADMQAEKLNTKINNSLGSAFEGKCYLGLDETVAKARGEYQVELEDDKLTFKRKDGTPLFYNNSKVTDVKNFALLFFKENPKWQAAGDGSEKGNGKTKTVTQPPNAGNSGYPSKTSRFSAYKEASKLEK